MLRKWADATINIDVEYSMNRQQSDLKVRRESKEVDDSTYRKQMDDFLFRAPRANGTAIFIKHNDKHYLLTARHVIYDPTALDSNSIFDLIMLVRRPNDLKIKDSVIVFGQGNVFTFGRQISELNSYGREGGNTFMLSSEAEDIGLIALDAHSRGSEFVKTLLDRGYKPVSTNDIIPSIRLKVGQVVNVIGFPARLSELGVFEQPHALDISSSRRVSLPIVSEGSVVDIRPGDSHIECNVFAYPGNSGGPLISNNKLVGIVSNITWKQMFSADGRPIYISGKWLFAKTDKILSMISELESRGPYYPYSIPGKK